MERDALQLNATIVHRRAQGKSLAFATVDCAGGSDALVIVSPDSSAATTTPLDVDPDCAHEDAWRALLAKVASNSAPAFRLQIVFELSRFTSAGGDPFPARRSCLHPGDACELVCTLSNWGDRPVVLRWRKLTTTDQVMGARPRHFALPVAPDIGDNTGFADLVMSSHEVVGKADWWESGQAIAPSKVWGTSVSVEGEDRRAERDTRTAETSERLLREYHEGEVQGKASKKLRARLFAEYLVQEFGVEVLSAGAGVLDVAGGKGLISFTLASQFGVKSTVVEPGSRRGSDSGLPKPERRRLRAQGREHLVDFVEAALDDKFVATSQGAALLAGCSMLIGMHPDEATESIVKFALAHEKPFAVVPCCVFRHLNPWRRLKSGFEVRDINDLVTYISEKANDAGGTSRTSHLGFEGRDKVVSWSLTQPAIQPVQKLNEDDVFCGVCRSDNEFF